MVSLHLLIRGTLDILARKFQYLFKQRGIARSAVDDARTMRDLQRVRLTQARQKLADATLHAPFDALVARRFVDSFVNVNAAQPVLRLHAAEELYVVANVPEHLSATVSADDIQDLYATFSFTGDERFPLEFRENRGEADRIIQSIEVSFAMRRSEQWNLMPGMTATVHILLKENGITSVLVPLAAVVADEEKQLFVWVVDPTTQVVSRRYVTVSETKADGAVLTTGVTDGDIIVTTGAATLREGVRVRPMDDSERA